MCFFFITPICLQLFFFSIVFLSSSSPFLSTSSSFLSYSFPFLTFKFFFSFSFSGYIYTKAGCNMHLFNAPFYVGVRTHSLSFKCVLHKHHLLFPCSSSFSSSTPSSSFFINCIFVFIFSSFILVFFFFLFVLLSSSKRLLKYRKFHTTIRLVW